jgi:hypothetical protein
MPKRCSHCGCFLTPINAGTDRVCGNERCPESWQAARRDFETSMLGAAIRKAIGR